MIEFKNSVNEPPYLILKKKYEEAKSLKQDFIEAISISSYSPKKNEVDSRYVNLKTVDGHDFIFYTNYNSPKSIQFNEHNQVSVIIFWSKTNTQIRIKANIKKLSDSQSDKHYKSRIKNKNALAISSNQSMEISSYEDIYNNYKEVLNSNNLGERPSYWGGFSFKPYYFEFWTGDENRINKREAFLKESQIWGRSILQTWI